MAHSTTSPNRDISDRHAALWNGQAYDQIQRTQHRRLSIGRLYRLASHVLPYVPPALGYRLCDQLSFLAPRLPAWEQILVNLAHVLPHETESVRRRLAREVMGNLFKNYYDLLRSHAISAEELERTVDIRGLENIHALVAQRKPVIAAIPHIGNISLVAEPMATHIQRPIMVVVEQMADPTAHDLLNNLRRRRNVEIVELGPRTARTIMQGLRDGKVIVLASDRTVTNATVEVEFFGAPARVPAGPAVLALRTGARLLTAYTYRQPSNRSIVVIDPPLALDRRGELHADVRRTMQAVIRIFERYIRHHPSQWLITERVWKSE
jgi:lauroyl/myristoyl acyltransferase